MDTRLFEVALAQNYNIKNYKTYILKLWYFCEQSLTIRYVNQNFPDIMDMTCTKHVM